MELSQLADLSIRILTSVITHKTGIPRISTSESVLSESEMEYLKLYKKMNDLQFQLDQINAKSRDSDIQKMSESQQSEQLHEINCKLKFNDLVQKSVITSFPILDAMIQGSNSGIEKSTLLKLLSSRDNLTRSYTERSRVVGELQRNLTNLVRENRDLHAENQNLVTHIDGIMDGIRQEHTSQFSEEQLDEYNIAKEELEQARKQTSVLNELLIALVVATGLDWSNNLLLKTIVMDCGTELQSDTTNDLEDLGLI